ncbi:MAG: MFS transporter [candidate division NC10 bacterium]|nr:MFS transporter [candidate division NC10 bacterium]
MARFPFPVGPVLFVTAIFYLNFAARVILAPLLPVVETELSIGHGTAGSLFFFIQIGYAAGLMASGLVALRLTYRRTIAVSSLFVGAALLVTSQAESLVGLRLGLLGIGTAAGLYLPAGIATVTDLTEERHWGKALALHEIAPNLGFITAPLVAEFALKLVSWRGALALLGVCSLLVGVAFGLWGRGGERRGEAPRPDILGRMLAGPSVWVAGLLFSVGIGGGMGIFTMLTLFMVSDLGLSRGWANALTSLSRTLAVPMLLVAGWLTDRLGPRRALAVGLSITGAATLSLGMIRHPVGTPVLVLLQAATAVFFFPPGFALVSASLPLELRALGISLATTMGSLLGGGAVPSAIGFAAEMHSFGLGFVLMGLLTLASPLLLRLETRNCSRNNVD